MLRAVIHAGLHKTATTSFQKCCSQLHDELIQQGIYYPQCNSNNHNPLIGRPNLNWVKSTVRDARSSAGSDSCLLISAENLEYHFHQNLPKRMEAALFRAGVERVDWVLCFRRPFETFSSLYGQLSLGRQNIKGARSILQFEATGHLISARHTLTLQSRAHTQHFYFNYPALISDLRRKLKGQVLGISFKDFTERANLPGDLLIQALARNGEVFSDLSSTLPNHRNTSPSREQIERNYLRRFLGLNDSDDRTGSDDRSEPPWFEQALKSRLDTRARQERRIRRLFKRTFPDWNQAASSREEILRMLRP